MATFSTLYWNYGLLSNFTEQLTRLDAIYFTIGTLTTAGTGTISAVSQTARTLQGLQMVLDLGLIVFAVALAIASGDFIPNAEAARLIARLRATM